MIVLIHQAKIPATLEEYQPEIVMKQSLKHEKKIVNNVTLRGLSKNNAQLRVHGIVY